MNGDLIYREILKAHLRAIVEYYKVEMEKAAEREAWPHRYHCKVAKLATEDVIELVDTLDAVREWIPVAAELPEEGQMVLVTTKTQKGIKSINRAYQSGGFWHGSGSMAHVTAWMPLPEPYEEEEE